MPLPPAPPAKLTDAERAAQFEALEEGMRVHFSDLLTLDAVAHDPETITYADALAAVILNLQNILTAEPLAFDLVGAYVPSAHSYKPYWMYLYDLRATI